MFTARAYRLVSGTVEPPTVKASAPRLAPFIAPFNIGHDSLPRAA